MSKLPAKSRVLTRHSLPPPPKTKRSKHCVTHDITRLPAKHVNVLPEAVNTILPGHASSPLLPVNDITFSSADRDPIITGRESCIPHSSCVKKKRDTPLITLRSKFLHSCISKCQQTSNIIAPRSVTLRKDRITQSDSLNERGRGGLK